jgi:dienelactone hydrolase
MGVLAASAWVLLLTATGQAAVPRALPEGKVPHDARLAEPRTLNSYFPFQPPETVEAWNTRAAEVRRQMLVALGLWPMPTKTPDNAVVHGRIDRGDYTIDKVFLESYPGHFVTGNLYKPKGKSGKLPAVLSPHGHWQNGRFYDEGAQQVRQRIVEGAERFEAGGRSPLQARCVQLARMGCIVFHYDMVGYGDSTQILHRPGYRSAMNKPEAWGFFSPQAESRLQSVMGLQAYNSIRALDWLCSLDDVDPARVAVTGASGGGTQTFILCALDPRPKVAFPAVMVSTGMQGGCTCENCCYLRRGLGNVEIAALFAPKPLGMTAADDWTREIAGKGLPELKRLYTLLGVPELVMAKPLLQFGHNYNFVSRSVMYSWLNQHLALGLEEPVVEEDYQLSSPAELSVWNDKHKRPAAGMETEQALLKWMTDDAQKQIAALVPKDEASLKQYREVVGGAFDVLVGRQLPAAGALEAELVHEDLVKQEGRDWLELVVLLKNKERSEEIPSVYFYPKDWNGTVVLWIDEAGKAGLYDSSVQPRAEVLKLLESGAAVGGADLFFQGEFLTGLDANAKSPVQQAMKGFAGYAAGYNDPLFAQRVHDVLSLVSFVKHHPQHPPKRIQLVGLNGAGPWVAAACSQLHGEVERAAIDTAGSRFANVAALDEPGFWPGAAKYGDVPGLLALAAPLPLWLAGEGAELPALVSAAYQSAGAAGQAVVYAGEEAGEAAAAVEWLLK